MLNKISLAIVLLIFTATAGHTQQIRNGGLSGTIMSFTGSTSGTTATNLFTTPVGNKAGHFILTQFCGNTNFGNSVHTLALHGSVLGVINKVRGDFFDEEACVSFTPGIALSKDETLSCQATGGDPNNSTGHCMITGVLSKR